jgi:serine/threonine protein kinase
MICRRSSLPSAMKKGIALDIARGLSALHQCGVVHGDLKPANILAFLKPELHAKIADFSHSFLDTGRTRNLVGGSYIYAAPEWRSRRSLTLGRAFHTSDGEWCFSPKCVFFHDTRKQRAAPRNCFITAHWINAQLERRGAESAQGCRNSQSRPYYHVGRHQCYCQGRPACAYWKAHQVGNLGTPERSSSAMGTSFTLAARS